MPPTLTLRRSTVKARLLLAMSEDRARPSRTVDLSAALGYSDNTTVSVMLANLITIGAVERVGRGQYIRLVGPVRGVNG